jgi:small subunit ribosomal protein S17e
VDRIKRLSMQVLDQHKDKFTVDFADNKKILDQLAVVRSKGLKNEMAGYITKLLKREKDQITAKEQPEEEEIEAVEEEIEEVAEETPESEIPQEITVESSEES